MRAVFFRPQTKNVIPAKFFYYQSCGIGEVNATLVLKVSNLVIASNIPLDKISLHL